MARHNQARCCLVSTNHGVQGRLQVDAQGIVQGHDHGSLVVFGHPGQSKSTSNGHHAFPQNLRAGQQAADLASERGCCSMTGLRLARHECLSGGFGLQLAQVYFLLETMVRRPAIIPGWYNNGLEQDFENLIDFLLGHQPGDFAGPQVSGG